MNILYEFRFEDGRRIQFRVTDQSVAPEHSVPAWVRLEHCRCTGCPLSPADTSYCPAALKILPVVEKFQAEDAYERVVVRVTDEHREYRKETTVEEALRSLLGLKMATSGCPLLAELKPMAVHHLPFASTEEFILRTVSHYLLEQYFVWRHQGEPDWGLAGLVERNQRLQQVNQALWQRIHTVCQGDSNLRVLLNFFSMASSVSFSLESQLRKLEAKLLE